MREVTGTPTVSVSHTGGVGLTIARQLPVRVAGRSPCVAVPSRAQQEWSNERARIFSGSDHTGVTSFVHCLGKKYPVGNSILISPTDPVGLSRACVANYPQTPAPPLEVWQAMMSRPEGRCRRQQLDHTIRLVRSIGYFTGAYARCICSLRQL